MSRISLESRGAELPAGNLSLEFVVYVVGTLDFVLVLLSGLAAEWLRFGEVALTGTRGLVVCLAALSTCLVFKYFRLYRITRLGSPLFQARRVIVGLLVVFLAVLVVGYMTKSLHDFSRLWLSYWIAGSLATLLVTRVSIATVYGGPDGSLALLQRSVLIGRAEDLDRVERFVQHWKSHMAPNFALLGVYLDRLPAGDDSDAKLSVPILGSVEDLVRHAEWNKIDRVVIPMPAQEIAHFEDTLETLRSVALNVDMVTVDADPFWADRDISTVAKLPCVRIMSKPLDNGQVLLKRTVDITCSLAAMILLAPFMLLLALAIKIDSPGPILFRQQRHGLNNRPFELYKFRTMFHRPGDVADVPQATRRDPRVTRLGRLLRATSFDELPQFLNVLKGDMSIVGPRPHAVVHNEAYAELIDSYVARHRLKPGITGWAQVHGFRGETSTVDKMSKRVEYDLYYVDHWSLKLDVKIMLMTLGVLVHTNAY